MRLSFKDSGKTAFFSLALLVSLVPLRQGYAQTGCGYDEPSTADFSRQILTDGYSELIQMDIAYDGRVFFAEKVKGRVHVYKPGPNNTTGTSKQIAQLNVYATNSTADSPGNRADGILGLVLDPGFASNNWIYIYYSVLPDTLNRVSRFTVVGDTLTAETTILNVPTHRKACCHSAGGITFDASGNLYVATGDNSPVTTNTVNPNATSTSGNTNDLRGKILRVTPLATGGYSIPAGNLFPPGTDSTKPEIYAMGLRNPLRIAVDPKRGWLLAGDVGPDGTTIEMDEVNLIKSAGNYGWPFLVGNYKYTLNGAPADSNNLVNNAANNTGKKRLPPARQAMLWYKYDGTNNLGFNTALFDESPSNGRVAAAGPIYYYKPTLNSTVKFPPYFHGKWFFFDYKKRFIKAFTLDSTGKFIDARDYFTALVFGSSGFTRMTDLKFGPDGSMYVLEYGSNTDYTGSTSGAVHRITYMPPTPSCLPSNPDAVGIAAGPRAPGVGRFLNNGTSRFELPAGATGAVLYNAGGRKVWEYDTPRGQVPAAAVDLPADLPLGLYHWKALR